MRSQVEKMAKTKIFGWKNIFGRNGFRMVQNVFLNENLDFEKISHYELTAIFSKMESQVEEMAKINIFGRKFFFGRNRFRMVPNLF